MSSYATQVHIQPLQRSAPLDGEARRSPLGDAIFQPPGGDAALAQRRHRLDREHAVRAAAVRHDCAALGHRPGERSEPLITPEGAFLFLAEDRKYAGTLPIDEVRPEIEKSLVQQSSRKAMERWLEKLRRNAYVKHF